VPLAALFGTHGFVECPLRADIVAKVENRTTLNGGPKAPSRRPKSETFVGMNQPGLSEWKLTNPKKSLKTSGDHPIARPTGILQAQNFSNLPHRQSLGGHRTSNRVNRKSRTLPRSDCQQRPPSHPINRVAAFDRIGRPLSIGIGGRLSSESVSACAFRGIESTDFTAS
jgi:hypothetical protein